MNQIIESYKDMWVNWKNFSGRTRRSAFWYAVLANMIVSWVLGFISGMLDLAIIASLYVLVALVPSIALCVRRLHDTSHSGWWYLLAFVPLANIVLLVFFCQDSHPDNQYGPSPKGYSAPMGYGAGAPYNPPYPAAPQNPPYQAPQTPPQNNDNSGGNNYYKGPEL